MKKLADQKLFASKSSKAHTAIAAAMADEIKKIIYEYSDEIPLALAVGVLRIVEQEIMRDHE